MTYADKLKDPRWQKKRLQVFERDRFTCTLCGDKETTLHVHHIEYEQFKDPWEYGIEKLKTLCSHCHVLVEYFKPLSFYPEYIYKHRKGDGLHMLCFGMENGSPFAWICYLTESISEVLEIIVIRENKLDLLNNEFKKFKERNG